MGNHGKGVIILLTTIKYRMKCIIKSNGLFAWGLVLPIVLATLFFLSIGELYTKANEEKIPIGIVSEEKININNIFDKNIFNVYELTETMAEKYLEDGVIAAYAKIGKSAELIAINSEKEQLISMLYLNAYMTGIEQEEIKHIVKEIQAADYVSSQNFIFIYYRLPIVVLLCIALSGLLLISAVRANRKAVSIRTHMAPISPNYILFYDIIIEVIIVIVLATLIYLYLYFILLWKI